MNIDTLLAMPTTIHELADIAQLEYIGSYRAKNHKKANCYNTLYRFYLDNNPYYVRILTSYKTEICGYIYDTKGNSWLYITEYINNPYENTATTRQHICYFLKEFTSLTSSTQLKQLKPCKIYPLN